MKKVIVALLSANLLAAPALAAKDKPIKMAANAARAPAAARPVGMPQLPPPEAMIILIRSSIVALSHANLTNNYTVLSGLGSPNFRVANTPQRLSQVFESFRANRIDMNPVVFVTPQLTYQPAIQNGKMRLVGHFPTSPMRVNFDMQFEPDQGQWKLFALGVNLDQAAPAAPSVPARKPGKEGR